MIFENMIGKMNAEDLLSSHHPCCNCKWSRLLYLSGHDNLEEGIDAVLDNFHC